MRQPLFRDRREAGRRLAARLARFAGQDALVLALPRGGVPVAFEVAQSLGAELDVLVARKLGVPGRSELAFGAIAGDERILDEETVAALGITREAIAGVEAEERLEAQRRTLAYRAGRAAPRVEGRIVVLVDDGVATGSTAKAALRALRRQAPRLLVFAAPVGPLRAQRDLEDEADQVELAAAPRLFGAVGYWYEDFDATGDDEVVGLLAAARKAELATAAPAAESEVAIPAGDDRGDRSHALTPLHLPVAREEPPDTYPWGA